VPSPRYVAERLRAHARLCRHIAEKTWSEDRAIELVRLADECTFAANSIAAGGPAPDSHDAIPAGARFR